MRRGARPGIPPVGFGTGFRKADPYECDPGRWSVLGQDWLWRREPLPRQVRAGLTREFVKPGAGGKEAMRVAISDDDLNERGGYTPGTN